ncbi:Rhomboid protein 1, mitochondrial [Teratosphaeria destructans]|uniref:Rhomboid protein 1, mitochondrial n=1 Tax=Teratosphaeria destructans TaxID=418781 RepID=A0A9W7SR79_9PEZI|nr:Rhomboid protein 1, mitochondrial [Teratosphaeria destructans]
MAWRAPCGRARAKPLLQLFHGYARLRLRDKYGTTCPSPPSRQTVPFSTTQWLSARAKPKRPPPPPEYRDAPHAIVPAPKGETAQGVGAAVAEAGEEELTWRDYDAEGGMPLPGREADLSQEELDGVFGTTPHPIDRDTGNYILRVLHWRRMSGALIDVGLTFPRWTEASGEQIEHGLQYVRSLVPEYDERAAGAVWAEEESHRQAEVLRARAVKLGIYRDLEGEEEESMTEEEKREAVEFEEREREREQGTEEGRARTGESALLQLRRHNEAEWEARQAEKAARKEREEIAAIHTQRGPLELLGGVQPPVALVKASDTKTSLWRLPRVEKSAWIKKYEDAATLTQDTTVPHLSTTRRLLPSFLVLLLTLSATYALAKTYTPPPRSARRWPDTPVAIATLTALTAVLLTTFVAFRLPPLWRLATPTSPSCPPSPTPQRRRQPLPPRHPAPPRHQPRHPLVLRLPPAHRRRRRPRHLPRPPARRRVLGNYTSLVYHVLRADWAAYITGVSAAVAGATAAVCVLRPRGSVHVPGTDVDVPYVAWVYLGVSVAREALMMLRGVRFGVGRRWVVAFTGRESGVDHAGHMGGLVVGMGAGWWLRRRRGRDREVVAG